MGHGRHGDGSGFLAPRNRDVTKVRPSALIGTA